MRTTLLVALQVLCSILILPTAHLHAQAPPSDFKFSATVGGASPWTETERITIDNTGQAKYVRYRTGGTPAILAESTFTVSASNLQQLWKVLQDSSFFSLTSSLTDTTVYDGMFARLVVTANGITHEVKIKNVEQSAIQSILSVLNAAVPEGFQLLYSPPEKFDLTPKDPCSPSPGGLRSGLEREKQQRASTDPKFLALTRPRPGTISSTTLVELSHPGAVVAYNVSLQDAINKGWVNLKSKGDFFGDAVSIEINNQNIPPPSNTIDITLYLEFWGPLATDENINPILADIAKAWDGATTSSGQKIQLEFSTRTDVNATQPPNTPGFDEIHLVNKGFRSRVYGGNFGANYGTASGTWEIGGQATEYAHEAGHLLGLHDRYDDYNKQPDGSWVDPKTGQTFQTNDDFAAYIQTKFPSQDLNSIKNQLMGTDTYSIPWDGHENDLMGAPGGHLLQSDIDQICAHPGLLVYIPDGTILVGRDSTAQNLTVTHRDAIFVQDGTSRVLEGIYTACIDNHKNIPSAGSVFDVAPPVSQWSGIQAAGYLAKVLDYADSAGLYCGTQLTTQDAIWRISDNSLNSAFDIASFFSSAGVNITGQLFDFPRLSGSGATDTSSHLFVPNELYVANIRPAFASGQIGEANGFTVTMSHPVGSAAPTGASWVATGPDGSPATITDTDSTASLTPARTGIYEIAVNFSVKDSLHGQRTFASDRKSYLIVPDAYTETFEHPGLTDRFPWQSYGGIPWTITNTNAQTGSYSATPGPVTSGQSSTLGIEVSLPTDSVIIFSVQSFTKAFFDGVQFSIDSMFVDFLGRASGWTIYKHTLSAGKHLLTWTYTGSSSTPGANVWIDNIFFPGNVVISSVDNAQPEVPKVFALEQSYPNPFNPTTTIKYTVGQVKEGESGRGGEGESNVLVQLIVYDILGRQVAVLVNERKAPGQYQVRFDGTGFASGVYFYRLRAGSFIEERKMLLLR